MSIPQLGRLLTLLGLVLSGCAADTPTDDRITRIAEDVQLLDPAAAEATLVFDDRLEVPVDLVDTLADVEVGTVLVSDTGSGLLRRVTSISPVGDTVVMATEQAMLTDAVEDGLVEVRLQNGKADIHGLSFDGFSGGLGNGFFFGRGDVDLSVEKASFDFDPAMDVDIDIERGSLAYFNAVAAGSLDASLEVKVALEDVNAGTEYDYPIWSREYVFVQWIGFVPVVETVELSLFVGVRVDADVVGRADVTLGGSTHGSVAAGARYVDGDWRRIGERQLSFAPLPVSISAPGELHVRVFLSAQILVKLYDIVGPSISVGTYAGVARAHDAGEDQFMYRVGVFGEWRGQVSLPFIDDAWFGVHGHLFDVYREFPAQELADPDLEPMCTNTCPYANDGECDDGGTDADYAICELGTDCGDCGARVPTVVPQDRSAVD